MADLLLDLLATCHRARGMGINRKGQGETQQKRQGTYAPAYRNHACLPKEAHFVNLPKPINDVRQFIVSDYLLNINHCRRPTPAHPQAGSAPYNDELHFYGPPMLRVFGIRRCDTVSRAMAWLNEHQIEFHLHDYKKDGVPGDRLTDWIEQAGWRSVVNTRGTTFRKLPPEQTADLDDLRAHRLLTENPSAIRRPIIEHRGKLLIGFDPLRWSEIFK